MKKKSTKLNLTEPINQKNLFGYDNYFNLFKDLYKNNKLPNCILLTGQKGIGKATFAYHFINFLLSNKLKNEYILNKFEITEDSNTYKQIKTGTHPNFFLLDTNIGDNEIKIEQTRNLLKFLSKSTYKRDLKIVLIDNFEKLNLNSSNSILKAIEEPGENTFFFIVHDSSYKMLETIRSRCMNFKVYFNQDKKNQILKSILESHEIDQQYISLFDDLFFDSPGNILIKILILNQFEKSSELNSIENVNFFLETYLNEENPILLNFGCFFIQKFYYELCLKNSANSGIYFQNYSKILKQINNMKNFNLNEKNVLTSIKKTISNEAR